ncbi:ATPase [Sphingomonas sp. GCM10030256]|uniref:ATPase n=1 Tax=Sphingomonas sp. GCM10030256 TaxID=3273427 RepID=UPI003618126A
MRNILFLLTALLATPAAAEVKSSSANAFEIEHRVQTVVPPTALFDAFGRIGSWWSPDHTYSGDAANLSLKLVAGGCFCERLKGGGGVEHLRVSYVDPVKHMAVLSGALGPLLFEGATGAMTVRVEPIAGGSRLTLNYRVAGFVQGNGAKLAPLVDQVLGEQMKRLRSFAAASNGRAARP